MFTKGLSNQETKNELKKFFEIETGIDKEELLCKIGDTRNNRVYYFRKNKTMRF